MTSERAKMIAINKCNCNSIWKGLKISELCKLIETSVRSGKYPLDDQQQKAFANSVEVINRSDSEDLKSTDIRIEVRIQNLYTINNYLPNIQHLPGVIEMDVLDSFRMLCRRFGRISDDTDLDRFSTSVTISKDKLYNLGSKKD